MEILKPDCLYIEYLNSLTLRDGSIQVAKDLMHLKGRSQDKTKRKVIN